MTATEFLIVLATFTGPIAAVQAQKWIERAREERERKLRIFHILMATRAVRAGSIDHVQALNSIERFFRGRSAKERAVREAWRLYLDHLTQERLSEQTPLAELKAHNERAVELLIGLLEALGNALGYHFDRVQLKRGAYYPQGHADEANAQAFIRNGLAKVLQGQASIPMVVTSFPFSEEATQKQLAANEALIKIASEQEKPPQAD